MGDKTHSCLWLLIHGAHPHNLPDWEDGERPLEEKGQETLRGRRRGDSSLPKTGSGGLEDRRTWSIDSMSGRTHEAFSTRQSPWWGWGTDSETSLFSFPLW